MSQTVNDRNVIIISSIDWNFNWQGPQEIALRLAKAGNRVLFIENTGVRRPTWKDAGRAWQRLTGWRIKIGSNGFAEADSNLFLCSPIVLPPFGRPLQKYLNRRLFFPFITKIANRLKMHDPIILTFLPTDTAHELIKTLKGDKSRILYYVASDFAELVSNPADLSASERDIVKICDAVLTVCPSLTDRYQAFGAKVYTIPYGVDLSVFQSGGGGDVRDVREECDEGVISEFKAGGGGRRRVIGYVGAFHRYMNVDLLAECARRRKDWLWVFVGPVEEDPGRLKNLPNVLFAGARAHKCLSNFIRDFDVGIIPYLKVKYTETVVPVKLNEYLAAGKPVVSTDIPAVCEFNDSHDVIKISENRADEFLRAVEAALDVETPEMVEKRKRVAALSDWKIHFDRICRIINSDLSEGVEAQ